jgi:hypothetical protein
MTREIPVNHKPLYVIAAALIVSMPGTSAGQERAPGVSPDTGLDVGTEYSPLGIRAGGFRIFPATEFSASYDDNIYATKDNTRSDYIFVVGPTVEVQSEFSRHFIGFNVFSRVGRYVDETKENYWDYGIESEGQLDITSTNNLQGGFTVARLHDSRDDPEDDATLAESVRPVRYMNYAANLAYNHLFNRVTFRVGAVFNRDDYRQGAGSARQNDRDVNEYTGLLRVGYNVSPRINTFVEGLYNVERRDVHRDSDGFERDNNGWGARTGVDVNFTDLLFGEAFVGYVTQYYDDSAFDTESGVNYGLNLTWLPTLLTTVTLTGGSEFEPTTNEDASSNFESTVGLRVDHELLRNVLIGAEGGYVRSDFSNANRTDNRFDAGADVTYLINRHFSVGAAYGFSTRNSDDEQDEFDSNVFTVRVRAQL